MSHIAEETISYHRAPVAIDMFSFYHLIRNIRYAFAIACALALLDVRAAEIEFSGVFTSAEKTAIFPIPPLPDVAGIPFSGTLTYDVDWPGGNGAPFSHPFDPSLPELFRGGPLIHLDVSGLPLALVDGNPVPFPSNIVDDRIWITDGTVDTFQAIGTAFHDKFVVVHLSDVTGTALATDTSLPNSLSLGDWTTATLDYGIHGEGFVVHGQILSLNTVPDGGATFGLLSCGAAMLFFVHPRRGRIMQLWKRGFQ